jgi:hypothetical protein
MCDEDVNLLGCGNKCYNKVTYTKESQGIGYFIRTDVVIHTHTHSKYTIQNMMNCPILRPIRRTGMEDTS